MLSWLDVICCSPVTLFSSDSIISDFLICCIHLLKLSLIVRVLNCLLMLPFDFVIYSRKGVILCCLVMLSSDVSFDAVI
jgi:hypothetical protein